jgi:hypothetical protein
MKEHAGKVRVGVLRGGRQNHEISLDEGGKLIAYITETLPNTCTPIDIEVDGEGLWRMQGVPVLPFDVVPLIDVLWDTTVPAMSQVLEGHIPLFRIPHFAASMTTSKALLREHMKTAGILMPLHFVLPLYQSDIDGSIEQYAVAKARDVHGKFGAPWMVQSLVDVSNTPVHVAKTFPQLILAIADLARHNTGILVEELIPGKRGGVHTVAGFRKHIPGETGDLYHMLPYEIRRNGIEPVGNFSDVENQKLYDLCDMIFNHIGAENYLHVNFVIHKRGAIYITDISLSPDFSDKETLARSANTVGAETKEVFETIIDSVLTQYN